MTDRRKKQRQKVRVESPSCACGHVGHMTADELKERSAHDDVDLSCPVCGRVHLSQEEIEELESQRVVDSKRYEEMRTEAEGRGV